MAMESQIGENQTKINGDFPQTFTGVLNGETNETSAEIGKPAVDLYDVSYKIRKFSCPVLCLVGFLGNFFIISILGKKKNRNSSTARYLLCLAFSDTIVLYVGYFCEWILLQWHYDIRTINDFSCKLHMFLTYFSLQYSSWILVLVTMERTVGVLKPYKVRILCELQRSLIFVIVTAVILALANGHFLFGIVSGYNSFNMRNCTFISDKYMEFIIDVWTIIDFMLCFAIPFVFIFIGNVVIILKMLRTERQRKNIVANERKKTSLTVMLLLLCVVFTVCTGPGAIYMPLIFPRLAQTLNANQMAVPVFLFDMFNILAGLNATLNFILYFLIGTKFRKEVKAFFTCERVQRQGIF